MKIKRFILIPLAIVTLTSCQLSNPPQDGTIGNTENVTHEENAVLNDIGVKKVRPSVADLVQVPDEPETHAPIEPGIYGTEESQGLEYQLEGDSYTVVGMGTCADTLLVIPAVHEGLPVKAIGKQAFKEQNQIVSIVIPEGVEKLCMGAFNACAALRNIRLPSTLRLMEQYSFSSCESLIEIIIPEGIPEIQMRTFAHCTGLQRVKLPSSICLIDNYAFYGCLSLHSINLPEGLEELGDNVFAQCYALKNIHIPSTINKIGSGCLRSLGDLSDEINITPDGWIHNLYYDGTMEQYLEFASNMENSRMCTGAVNFFIGGELVEYLLVTEDMKIPEQAFYSCQSLKGVILPSTLFDDPNDLYSVIGWGAFSKCPNLEWIVIQGDLPEDKFFAENTCWLSMVMSQESVAHPLNLTTVSTVESIVLFVSETKDNAAPYLTKYQYLCNEDPMLSANSPGVLAYYTGEWEFNSDGKPIINSHN